MRSAAITTIVAAVALAAAACTSTHTGQASPTGGQSTASSGGTSSSAGPSLVGVNACTLLTDSEARQIVPDAQAHKDQGELGGAGTSNCQWSQPASNDQVPFTFSVTVRPSQDIKDVSPHRSGATLSSGTTSGGKRQAVILKGDDGPGSCLGSIAVGSGRVDMDAQTFRGTTDDACNVVNKISDYIDPRLPTS